VTAEKRHTPPAVKDLGATITAQMRDQWKSPQRQLWRIAYHPIKGMENSSAWHIDGTRWRVRVHPEWCKLDEFDQDAVYELDAVALDQNFGVIDFYVYHRQKVGK
jgi:hypothetical protein